VCAALKRWMSAKFDASPSETQATIDGYEIAAPEGADDHDRLEVLLADAWHLFLLLRVASSITE
jgi:hypothetical protein